ncbi:MAG: hypothetical protein PWR10_1532 [Halanaerobiales bacterium]|nr:hypothetical protein [Halanaerobiales bacterium]
MAGVKELKKIIKTIILEVFPELQGYHYPIKGKVVKVYEAGGQSDEFNNIYSCDVQPLNKSGSVDENAPVIPDVEIPVIWAGPQRGIYALPEIGSIVRVGFYYHDPAQPFIDAVLGDGYEMPDHFLGSLVIQQANGIKIEINKQGEIIIKSTEKITAETDKLFELLAPIIYIMEQNDEEDKTHPIAFADIVKNIFDNHIHPYGSSFTGPPAEKMTGHASQISFTK